MAFFSMILKPKDPNSCVSMFREHAETLCDRCGIEKIITLDKPLRLTMVVLDIDYGAFIRRPLDWDTFGYETPQFVLNNRFKFTLKIKSTNDQEAIIICHLHEGNKYQSQIDLHLNSGTTYVFSCQQTCSIHLIGYYLSL